jgi:glycopeptide antibiotics resistance protein
MQRNKITVKLLASIQNRWLMLTIIILILITLLSLLPLAELPQVTGGNRIHHLAAYAVLMFPAALRKPNKWLFLAVSFILYSGGIELLQPFVNRYCEWQDLAFNTLGIICGICIAQIIIFADNH